MDAISCTLQTLLACFSLSGLYVDTGLSYQDSQTPHQIWQTNVNRTPSGAIETVKQQVTTDDPFNPYGRLSIGYELQFRSLTLALEASHVSSIKEDDRGINSVGLRARWYPFRR